MKTKLVEVESDYLHAWVDQDVHLMYSEWKHSVTSEEYRKGNLLLIDMLHRHEIRYWIVDSSRLGVVSPDDEVWTIQEIVPQVISSVISKLARLSGEDRISFIKFKEFVEKAAIEGQGNLEVRQYITFKEAADWIGGIYL